jgi:5'-3' exonuclease
VGELPSVHLVDATYELFRAWFGAPPRKAPDGREVGALRGVLGSMLKMLRDGVTHVGCATDHVVRSFRNDLYAGYKTDEGVEPELLAQFPLLEEGLRALGLVVWPMVEFEADDALATAAARYAPEAERVYLATVDKDLAQCARGEHVVMLDRRRDDAVLDEAGVIAKFGVPPALIADYLALVGDSADGYPGLPGWGAKSAAAVLSAHGPIEAVPLDASKWQVKVRGADKLAATLRERIDDARLFKRLATLRLDAPVREPLDELCWRGARPELRELTAAWGFEEMCERVPMWRE